MKDKIEDAKKISSHNKFLRPEAGVWTILALVERPAIYLLSLTVISVTEIITVAKNPARKGTALNPGVSVLV